ncbi:MFS transporter [Bailinhaonella thermotolerans]|uniref:MFS transporter n=1 Tax=Bailinhaonella thermotolerans TaxID=1070861 RepID=A0A3A4A5Z6_9ACTN|nr:MFS transporter [Bailinhaonella thermotolerans]RJL23279.1 MFS transporter [Bailinhaonella thermotolerans]
MDTTAAPQALGDRLDRLPLTSFHRKLVIALAGMILFEWVETHSFAYVLPALRAQWDAPLSTFAAIAAVGSLGAFTGGVLGGYLADRIGRRRAMLTFSATYCTAAVLCALVQSPGQLMAARALAFFGAQGTAVIAIVTLSEFVPASARGRLQTHKVLVGSLGIPIAAWLGYFLIPNWPSGWRVLFGIGTLGAVFAVLVWRWVPESPRWLMARGQVDRAHEIVCRIERECGVTPGASAVLHDTGPPAPRARVTELLSRDLRGRFLLASLMWVTGLLAYYAFTTWTPTLLSENGLHLSDTLLLSAVLASCAPLGALAAVPLIDRWDRRKTQLAIGVVLAAVLLLFSVAESHAAILAFGCLVSLLFQVAVPFLQVYTAEVFPTRVRALGAGTANAVSRIVNFGGPALVTGVYTTLGYTPVFVLLATLSVLGGCLAILFGPRTTGLPLESVESASPTPPR